MVNINELRITPDGKYLIIDVSVLPMKYYDNVFLDSIHIDTLKTFIETGPSNNPIYTYIIPDTTNNVYTNDLTKVLSEDLNDIIVEGSVGVKHIRHLVDIDSLGNNLFFVWILTKGLPSEGTPCGMKELLTLAIAYNKYPIYVQSMKHINSLDTCNPPKEFIDFILRKNAFKLSIKVGNYRKAIELWEKFFTEENNILISNCGCYGT